MKWKPIEEHPPDKPVLVKDYFGIINKAIPVYMSYIVKVKSSLRGTTINYVEYCTPYWTGDWKIVFRKNGLMHIPTHWKEIQEDKKKN